MFGLKTGVGIGALVGATYWLAVRPWHVRWGATDEEASGALPGDDLLPEPALMSTRAVTIEAPVDAVWPWLAQIGQGRGGFYSYTWLENIFGTHMENADRIVPEWQHLAVGDIVRTPRRSPYRSVVAIEPGRHIVLKDDWAFVLRPVDECTTRLIVRGHGFYTFPNLKNPVLRFIYWRLIFEPGSAA